MAGQIPAENPKTSVPIPPVDAQVITTACDYCPVACGYTALIWPVGEDGGPEAGENALGSSYPQGIQSGRWVSPNMHSVVTIDGGLKNVIVLPDPDAEVVNVRGNHSVRGGTLALKLYRPDGPTRDRLQRPLLRVNGSLQAISWDAATDIVAEVARHVIDEHGEISLGFKVYSYGFFENTHMAKRLAFGAIGTPNYAPHHNTADGTDTPGFDDTGADTFSASYEDYKEADTLFVVGADPYETKTVAFTSWMQPGGAKIIHMDPRKTFTSSYAEKHDGVHLQVTPGRDSWVFGAIGRYILEQGWEDADFIRDYVTQTRTEIEEDSKWRRRLFGLTADEWKQELLSEDDYIIENASRITGIPGEKLIRAAELLSQPVDGETPKSTILFEKGLYWSHNYENTAAIGNLSVLIGARGRPGRASSRMGGHQRGGMGGGSYPFDKSPTEYEGNKIEMDCDRWTVEGKTRMVWSIGNDWLNGSGATAYLRSRLHEMIRETEPQISTAVPERVIAQLKERVDNGGMFIVQQDVYLNETSEFADLILPAAQWGEEDFTRNNAERRLRLYGKIMDPPGEAKPDWRIMADIAKKMGYEGFDFANSNEVFEATHDFASGRKDYKVLIEKAQADGVPAHELVRSFGTGGIQTPLTLVDGELQGTPRMHTDMKFKASNGKSNFVTVDLDAVRERNDLLGPAGDEFWVLTGRVNHLWQSLYDDKRKPHLIQRYPMAFVEINPEDAARLSIESGDIVSVESDNVRTQDQKTSNGGFTAAAYVTDQVQPGTLFSFFHYPGSPGNSVVTGDAASQPINVRQPFKFGRGKLTRIGSSDLADVMPFGPRNLA